MHHKFAAQFHVACDEDIISGKVTDVYFERTRQILQAEKADKRVIAEFVVKSFPKNSSWGVFAGLEEAAHLLRRLPVKVWARPEGAIFHANEPAVIIEGNYLDFGQYETALLGLFCQASGIATQAARCRLAAGDRPVISFGARRMHPAIAPMIERNAYIGGCDGVATIASAELIEQEPVGTMPHALILLMGDTLTATQAFDRHIDSKVNRVCLVDTFNDEKFEALRIAEAMGKKLFAVRLDTPKSRRGDLVQLMKEIRWELDLRGHQHVRLFVSGGLDEETILRYNEVADAYGVGTSISSAQVLDFSMDIVEVDGKPLAKRGKRSGRKAVYYNPHTLESVVQPARAAAPSGMEPALALVWDGERWHGAEPEPKALREFVLQQLQQVDLN